MEKTICSNRVYKDILKENKVISIQNTLRSFNHAKFKTYRMEYEREVNQINHLKSISIHMFVKETIKTDDYYANSIVREAKGILSGQKEKQTLDVKNLENQIKTAEKKQKELNKKIKNKEKIVSSIIEFSKGKKKKITFYKGAIEGQKDSLYTVRLKKQTLLFFNLYNFEHLYLRPEIKKLKNRSCRIKERIHRLEMKVKKLEKGFKGATFGGKKHFKSQFTIKHYQKNHKRWKDELYEKKYFSFQVSGRKDAKYGNFVFKYVPEMKTLHFHTIDGSRIVAMSFCEPRS